MVPPVGMSGYKSGGKRREIPWLRGIRDGSLQSGGVVDIAANVRIIHVNFFFFEIVHFICYFYVLCVRIFFGGDMFRCLSCLDFSLGR